MQTGAKGLYNASGGRDSVPAPCPLFEKSGAKTLNILYQALVLCNSDCAKTIRFEVLSYLEVYISDLHYSLFSLYFRSIAAGATYFCYTAKVGKSVLKGGGIGGKAALMPPPLRIPVSLTADLLVTAARAFSLCCIVRLWFS